jgi:predicted negative regulator of RcsB-dependent stress response
VPLLRRSGHPALDWIFSRLEGLREAAGEAELDELMAIVRYRFARLLYIEGDVRRANELLTTLLTQSDPNWPVHGNVLNLRGVTWDRLDRKDSAIADYTAVIEAATVPDEARAMALNNRADIYEDHGDLASAIADRTAVLNLGETTYDRRFIALGRRARAS